MTDDQPYRCVEEFIRGDGQADLPTAAHGIPELCLRNSGGSNPNSHSKRASISNRLTVY